MTRDELLGALGAERVRALEKDIEDEAARSAWTPSRATNARRVHGPFCRDCLVISLHAQAVGDGDKGACPLCRHEVDPEDGVLSLKSLVDALEALDVNVERDARRGRRFRLAVEGVGAPVLRGGGRERRRRTGSSAAGRRGRRGGGGGGYRRRGFERFSTSSPRAPGPRQRSAWSSRSLPSFGHHRSQDRGRGTRRPAFGRHPFARAGGGQVSARRGSLSLKAASLGLNTCASRVILTDPWNAAIEDQAIDRCHRIGQTREVKVVRLLIRDTVENGFGTFSHRGSRPSASSCPYGICRTCSVACDAWNQPSSPSRSPVQLAGGSTRAPRDVGSDVEVARSGDGVEPLGIRGWDRRTRRNETKRDARAAT